MTPTDDSPEVRGLEHPAGGPQDGTLSESSLTEETHADRHSHGPTEVLRKIAAEAAEGNGPIDKLKRAAREIDRDISGEYERRDDRRPAEDSAGG